MEKRLQNKVAIVTGAARGLGKGIAKRLVNEGTKVVVADVLLEEAEKTAAELAQNGGAAMGLKVDVSKIDEVRAMFEKTEKDFGPLDIMVNNAGVNRDAMLHKMTLEQWDLVIAINLTGTFYCTQLAAQGMRERKSGRIVNIASASWLGNIGQANYAASKAGVVGLTKTASRELARSGVTANAICPGFIETDMTRGVPEKVWDIMVGKVPMGRAGQPSDVAAMVAFLASEDAAYITGEVINVGGGMIL